MRATLFDTPAETLEQKCRRLEHFETPEWAAQAILDKEILTKVVLDPCTGTGILADAAKGRGYTPLAIDINDWGYPGTMIEDFLSIDAEGWSSPDMPFSIFMNPPFSKAVQFVEKGFELGARKIVCFQRFAWWESRARREFWETFPPARVYVCGDRAPSWRHDIPHDKRNSSSPTAHAWFVWERYHAAGTKLGHIWRDA